MPSWQHHIMLDYTLPAIRLHYTLAPVRSPPHSTSRSLCSPLVYDDEAHYVASRLQSARVCGRDRRKDSPAACAVGSAGLVRAGASAGVWLEGLDGEWSSILVLLLLPLLLLLQSDLEAVVLRLALAGGD